MLRPLRFALWVRTQPNRLLAASTHTDKVMCKPQAHATAAEDQEKAAAAREQGVTILRDHLHQYLERNTPDATFVGWIAALHPENVSVDARLLLPNCEHRKLWIELNAGQKRSKPTGKRSNRSRHAGLVDATVGVVFVATTAGVTLALGATRGALHTTSKGLNLASKCTAACLPVSAVLRIVGGSLGIAEVAVSGASVVAVHSIAVAGGATCGILALSADTGRATHSRLRETHRLLKPSRTRHGTRRRSATCDETRPPPAEVECAVRASTLAASFTPVVGVPIPIVDAVPVK